MADNEWKKPAAPPPPLFFGKKERNLVKQVNDELIEKVIGQQILYYPIDIERTNFHDLYGEAIEKTFLPPIRVYALVEFTDYVTEYLENAGIDKIWEINVLIRYIIKRQCIHVINSGCSVIISITYIPGIS